ncbi:aspartate kinase [Caldicoprobacter faecalis]|uniref:Aspartokinase n=1 Tax=Caldicoprobacter faecalis TaxID=937334 RepID=A0A1I5V9S6_9FIRM|nr:MAG: aspartate kinase [Caldicoprobacter oshimai]SFQ04249.1 aspartate kinase [Caldicoprobacter faecalis]
MYQSHLTFILHNSIIILVILALGGLKEVGVIVAKFGGTSLANAQQFRKVQNIVLSDPRRRYVVVSAPGKCHSGDTKVTDLLYACHKKASQGQEFGDVFEVIAQRYMDIIKGLNLDLDFEPLLRDIKERIAAGASADYVASRGEYLNGLILAELLGYDFIDAAEIIFFDQNGVFDSERTNEAVARRLSHHERAVIPGFYGSMPNGEIKTFPRGGSDISGAIIARGVNAEVYENWTDVSGFLMADPRIVENPKPIRKITYRELRELAYMGASVLHEDSIFPVKKAGIPVHIKNTNAPDEPGTIIVNEAEPVTCTGGITGVAGRKGFTVIAIEKTLMHVELGFGRRLLSILEANGISFEHMPSGIDTISVVIADSQLDGKLEKVIEEIKAQLNPDSVEVHSNMALIATVGRGMARTPGIAAKLFTALGNEGINVRMIDQGSSEINIIVGVENEDMERAVRAIYYAFVDSCK